MKTIATGFCICFVLAIIPAVGRTGQTRLMTQTPGAMMPHPPMLHPPMSSTHPFGKAKPIKEKVGFAYKKIKFQYGDDESSMDVYVGKRRGAPRPPHHKYTRLPHRKYK